MTTLRTSRFRLDLDPDDNQLTVTDAHGRTVFRAPLAPVIRTVLNGEHIFLPLAAPVLTPEGEGVRMIWQGPENVKLEWVWRVSGDAVIAGPLQLTSEENVMIESIHLFSHRKEDQAVQPGGFSHRRIVPGIALGPEVSPIQHAFTGMNGSTSLGRGRGPAVHQQWGLPTHCF